MKIKYWVDSNTVAVTSKGVKKIRKTTKTTAKAAFVEVETDAIDLGITPEVAKDDLKVEAIIAAIPGIKMDFGVSMRP